MRDPTCTCKRHIVERKGNCATSRQQTWPRAVHTRHSLQWHQLKLTCGCIGPRFSQRSHIQRDTYFCWTHLRQQSLEGRKSNADSALQYPASDCNRSPAIDHHSVSSAVPCNRGGICTFCLESPPAATTYFCRCCRSF